jgi:hypothetical protein
MERRGLDLWQAVQGELDNSLKGWRERINQFGQVAAVEDRSNGRRWNDREIFKGIVLAVLSNSVDWSKVEPVLPDLNGLFLEFDLAEYATTKEKDIKEKFIPWFKERKADSQQLGQGLKRLIQTAAKLCGYSRQYGSVENFLTWLFKENGGDPKLLAKALGDAGVYKLPGLGIPLAAEALRNIGYNLAKPDRHINRAVGCFGLVEFARWTDRSERKSPPQPNAVALVSVMKAMETFSQEAGQTVTFADNAVWLLCAKSGIWMRNRDLVALATSRS